MISVYGASGFIGTEFCNQFTGCYVQARDEIEPHTNEVLFLASTVDNYNVWSNITIDIETNEILPLKVLESGRLKFGKNFKFTYISSWFVYGNTELPAKESGRCEPTGFYSITRLAGEMLVKSYCKTYDMPSWKILRLGNIIGVGDKKASLKKNALVHLVSEIAKGNKVQIYKEPSYRDFMDVRDCVDAIKLVMDKGLWEEIYNIGSGNTYNVREILESVDTENMIDYMDVPDFHKQVQVREFSLDTSKLRALGYSPQYQLQDTIQWMVGHYKNEQ